jgi:hypothetical protein
MYRNSRTKSLYCTIPALLIAIGLNSCSGALKREEYIKWVQNPKNGLHTIKEVNGFVFDLQYQPPDYVWLQSGGHNQPQLAAGSEKIQHYLLTISLVDSGLDILSDKVINNGEKQERLYYFSYVFQNDIQLEENGKLLPCVLFHFERPQDLRKERTFLLGFETPEQRAEMAKLVIRSEQFGSLPIKIRISKENIPTLTP